MRWINCIAVALLFGAALSARASEIEGYYWYMEPSGNGSVGIDGLEGTKVDLKNDLGYGDSEGVFGANVALGSSHQLALSYMAFNLSAENHVDRQIKFGDETFHADANVASSLDATLVRGAYRFQTGSDEVKGGFLLGAQYVDAKVEASAKDIGSDSENATVGLPVVGAFLRITPAPVLVLRGSVAYGKWDWDDISATFVDAEGSVALNLDPFYAGVGYRHIGIDGEDKSIPLKIDVTFSGPVAYVGLVF